MWILNFVSKFKAKHLCQTLFFNKVAGVTRIRIYSASHFSRIFLHSNWIRRDTEYLKDKEKEKRKKFWKFLKDAGRKSCEQWKIKLSQEEKVAKVTRFCLQHFLLATISTLKDSLMQIWNLSICLYSYKNDILKISHSES